MKYLVAFMVVVLVLAPASYAVTTAKDPRVPNLIRRVANIEVRVGAVERNVQATNAEVAALKQQAQQLATAISLVNDKDTCGFALTFDVFRVLISSLGGGDIGRFDDKGACARVGIGR